MFPLYRKQSIDLQCKSTDWFPYVENIGLTWVNVSLVTLGMSLLARLLVKTIYLPELHILDCYHIHYRYMYSN